MLANPSGVSYQPYTTYSHTYSNYVTYIFYFIYFTYSVHHRSGGSGYMHRHSVPDGLFHPDYRSEQRPDPRCHFGDSAYPCTCRCIQNMDFGEHQKQPPAYTPLQ